MSLITINIDDLLYQRTVESSRVEYKAGWDKPIEQKTLRTICAFANDLHNQNGGYIILGVETEPDSIVPSLPPVGLPEERLDRIMTEIRVLGTSRIDPPYTPIVEPKQVAGRWIVVVWVPGGDNRPYKAKDTDQNYYPYIRVGAETIKAEGHNLHLLMEQTARIPFDDRRNPHANVLDISPILTRRFLQAVRSDLLNRLPPPTDGEIYEAMRLVQRINGDASPKNVALLFFNEHPEQFFLYAFFEVVQFGDFGDLLEENTFIGPIAEVVRDVIRHLDNLTNIFLRKVPQQAEVERTVAFPYAALEEAIVNAAYHRSYEVTENSSEPCKVYLYPDRMEIWSYPGPVAGITAESLQGTPPQVPARNRRIGEFLKELRLAEMRGTGIPKIRRTMQENGSPQPRFDFADNYFCVTLPAHPRYVIIHSLRENSYLWSIGERHRAVDNLRLVMAKYPANGLVAGLLIEYLFYLGRDQEADDVFAAFQIAGGKSDDVSAYLSYFKGLMARDDRAFARQVIDSLPEQTYSQNPLDIAIALKRVGRLEKAHVLFNRIFDHYSNNPLYLQNYADTKTRIADNLRESDYRDWTTINRLRDQAIDLLRRAVKLFEGNQVELAWSWFHLARIMRLRGNQYSREDIEYAYNQAIALLPEEYRFKNSYEQWKRKPH